MLNIRGEYIWLTVTLLTFTVMLPNLYVSESLLLRSRDPYCLDKFDVIFKNHLVHMKKQIKKEIRSLPASWSKTSAVTIFWIDWSFSNIDSLHIRGILHSNAWHIVFRKSLTSSKKNLVDMRQVFATSIDSLARIFYFVQIQIGKGI